MLGGHSAYFLQPIVPYVALIRKMHTLHAPCCLKLWRMCLSICRGRTVALTPLPFGKSGKLPAGQQPIFTMLGFHSLVGNMPCMCNMVCSKALRTLCLLFLLMLEQPQPCSSRPKAPHLILLLLSLTSRDPVRHATNLLTQEESSTLSLKCVPRRKKPTLEVRTRAAQMHALAPQILLCTSVYCNWTTMGLRSHRTSQGHQV